MTWSYSPVWDVKNMHLGRFRLMRGSPGSSAREAVLRTDAAAVRKALEDLGSQGGDRSRASVIVPVHETSLTTAPERQQILGPVAAAPGAVRAKFIFEVAAGELASTPAAAEFIDAAGRLGLRCGVCSVLSGEHDGPAPADPGDAAAVEVSAGTEDAEALAGLTTFARRCRQVGRISAAYALENRALVLGAVAAGVRLLSGSAVQPPIEVLGPSRRFTLAELYAGRPRS